MLRQGINPLYNNSGSDYRQKNKGFFLKSNVFKLPPNNKSTKLMSHKIILHPKMVPKDIGKSLKSSTVCNVYSFIFIVLNLL